MITKKELNTNISKFNHALASLESSRKDILEFLILLYKEYYDDVKKVAGQESQYGTPNMHVRIPESNEVITSVEVKKVTEQYGCLAGLEEEYLIVNTEYEYYDDIEHHRYVIPLMYMYDKSKWIEYYTNYCVSLRQIKKEEEIERLEKRLSELKGE